MRLKEFTSRRFLFVYILPLITLVISLFLRKASGPFWEFGDPCYNYYFNAILILKGHVPMDITHPGTPLQVLVAVIIWILNLGRPIALIVNQALTNSEFYLGMVYLFLATCSFLTSAILAAYVYRKTDNKLAALLTQIVPLSFILMPSFDSGSITIPPVVANVSAEPVFICVMNLFNLFIFGLYFSENKSEELRNALLLALICGLGLATKINFLIIIFAAFFLISFRQKFIFITACVISFVFFTWPIIGKYPQLFQWVSGMVEHSSRYGTGDSKFIDWKSFYFYLHLMLQYDWFFIFSALGAWIWSSIFLIRDHQNRAVRFVWVLSFFCLVHILATAKHFSFHYLLPAFALFSSIFPLIYLNLEPKYKTLKPLIAVFILVFVSVTIYYAVPYYKKLSVFTEDIRDFNQKIKVEYPQCTLIPATTGDIDFFINQQMVLQRANGTNFRLISDELFNLYPQSIYFFSEEVTSPDPSVESYGIWNFKQRVFADDVLSASPCSIFVKYGSDFGSFPYQVRLLDHSKYLSAFLLTGSTEKQANLFFEKAMDASQEGDFQQAFALGLKSRELNYEPRGQLEYYLNLIYQQVLKTNPTLLNQKQ